MILPLHRLLTINCIIQRIIDLREDAVSVQPSPIHLLVPGIFVAKPNTRLTPSHRNLLDVFVRDDELLLATHERLVGWEEVDVDVVQDAVCAGHVQLLGVELIGHEGVTHC